jgi:hypothetical protein
MDTQTHTRMASGEGANQLSRRQILDMIKYMRSTGKIVPLGRDGLEKSLYATTGPAKHGQVDCRRVGFNGKILVHHIYWRYKNAFQLIDTTLHISHRDAEAEVLHLIAESRELNESRKYCHMFKWYKTRVGEQRPRCPHWEHPCSGM